MSSSGNSGPPIKRLKQFKQTLLTFGSNAQRLHRQSLRKVG
jgi:hypothetical protein